MQWHSQGESVEELSCCGDVLGLRVRVLLRFVRCSVSLVMPDALLAPRLGPAVAPPPSAEAVAAASAALLPGARRLELRLRTTSWPWLASLDFCAGLGGGRK